MALSKRTYTDQTTVITAENLNAIQDEVIANGNNITAIKEIVGNYNSAGFHNSIFRGKNLGTSVTTAQWNAISAGTFDDLFIGDYWAINGVNWRIAALDYWYRCGDTECTTHHAVIVPDSNLLTANGSTTHYLNTTSVTTGGYVGTGYFQGGLATPGTDPAGESVTAKADCVTLVNNAFGSAHVLNHREYFTNTVASGKPSGGGWYDSTVDLMNERMVYGNGVFTPVSDGSTVPANYTIDKGQLPLFALAPQYITNRASWWLRDVVSSTYFAIVNDTGLAYYNSASFAWVGVRPAFGIKA